MRNNFIHIWIDVYADAPCTEDHHLVIMKSLQTGSGCARSQHLEACQSSNNSSSNHGSNHNGNHSSNHHSIFFCLFSVTRAQAILNRGI